MNEWEAKYKILASGIADKKSVENAERLVEEAVRLSKRRGISLESVIDLMLCAVRLETPIREDLEQVLGNITKKKVTGQTFERPNFLGLPVSLQEWMPTHYAAMSNEKDLLITDLRTGKIKRVTKEDMERVIGEFFAKEKD